MQNERSQPDTTPKIADPPYTRAHPTSPNHHIAISPGPSRDMLGGPWLGIAVFVFIAIGLGWGLTKLFQGMVDQTRQTLDAQSLDHGFDPEATYTLTRDVLRGARAGGDLVLVPFKDEMPRGVPGRYSWPTAEQYAADPAGYNQSHDLIGIIEAGTAVRFVEVIDDQDNGQTRILVATRLLTGRYAGKTPILGMHLESAQTDETAGAVRYLPRADLFERVEDEEEKSAQDGGT